LRLQIYHLAALVDFGVEVKGGQKTNSEPNLATTRFNPNAVKNQETKRILETKIFSSIS
jgi:hypothetical protein